MKKISIVLVFLAILIKLGVYKHDEFIETHLFVKHGICWKWYLYSPIMQSDLKIEQLTPEQKYEQMMIDDFIKNNVNL